jgi:F-type H+-transporting ATPase subunit a
MAVLFIFSWAATRNLSLVPSRLQSIAELLIGGLYDFFKQVAGHHIAKFFPLVASLFLFIMIANWMGLLPGFGTIGFFHKPVHVAVETTTEATKEPAKEEKPSPVQNTHETVVTSDTKEITETAVTNEEKKEEEELEFIPILRASTADLNTTLALAITAVLAIQYFGFHLVGFSYITKFINFKDPINFVLGLLELISEISRIISFAFRLFGNIFAGEVLLAVMAFLMPFIVPLPFLMMELFVGFIQALVFSMLTAVFLNLAVAHGEEH